MARFAVTLLVASLVASACGSGTRTAVRTNNGGILDCGSETVEYAHYDYSDDARGSVGPHEALTVFASDPAFPPGTPQIEADRGDGVVFVFTADADNRLGRALAIRLSNGWVVQWTEQCG